MGDAVVPEQPPEEQQSRRGRVQIAAVLTPWRIVALVAVASRFPPQTAAPIRATCLHAQATAEARPHRPDISAPDAEARLERGGLSSPFVVCSRLMPGFLGGLMKKVGKVAKKVGITRTPESGSVSQEMNKQQHVDAIATHADAPSVPPKKPPPKKP